LIQALKQRLKKKVARSCLEEKKAIHEEKSHSDIQTHKDKDDNRGTFLRMGSCFEYRIDEHDT